MLGVIQPNTYRANMQHLRSDFYDYNNVDDELASNLIAKNIRRLLQKAPVLLARKNEMMENQMLSHSCPADTIGNFLHQDDSKDDVGRMFHSDSSLASSNSSISSDSTPSSSPVSQYSDFSFSRPKRPRKKIGRENLVILPRDMMNRLVRDVIRMSEGQEQGIRSCLLEVNAEDSETGVSATLGKIKCDSKLQVTCVIRVHLTAVPTPSQSHGSQVLLNRLLGSTKENTYIKPGYSLEKCKL